MRGFDVKWIVLSQNVSHCLFNPNKKSKSLNNHLINEGLNTPLKTTEESTKIRVDFSKTPKQ